jgi:hypothetical protein
MAKQSKYIQHAFSVSMLSLITLLSGCAMDMKYDCPLGGNGTQCMSEPHIYKAGYNNSTESTYVTNSGQNVHKESNHSDVTQRKNDGNLLASAFTNKQQQADLIAESLDSTGNIATVNTSTGLYRYRSPVIYQTWVNAYVDSHSDSLINAHTYNWVYRHSGWQTPLNSRIIESNTANKNLTPISITDTQAINQVAKGGNHA